MHTIAGFGRGVLVVWVALNRRLDIIKPEEVVGRVSPFRYTAGVLEHLGRGLSGKEYSHESNKKLVHGNFTE